VSEGLRKAEATVTVSEYDGTLQHFPLDRGLISKTGGRSAIPVILSNMQEVSKAMNWRW
jgi:hypothetical protein